MADTNINIVIVAANCLEGLARGLRDSFNKYKPSVAGLVMDRLKERKVTVVEALSGALNAMYSTVRPVLTQEISRFSSTIEVSAEHVLTSYPVYFVDIICRTAGGHSCECST